MSSLSPKTTALTRRQAAHLLRRTTFGPSRQQVDAFTGLSVKEALEQLLQTPSTSPAPPIQPGHSTSWLTDFNNPYSSAQLVILRFYLRRWWAAQMIQCDTITEKMVLFLHSHFTVKSSKVLFSTLLYHQNELFRQYSLGNFKKLTKKICTDTAMSYFLDNYANTAEQPNENLGRELLELYTIGKGAQVGLGDYTTYTDNDILEAAKVLTGHVISDIANNNLDPETGLLITRVAPDLHDTSDKLFSNRFQNTVIQGRSGKAGVMQELDELLAMIFGQEATARNIVRKLYRYFCYYKIDDDIEQNIITPLTQTFINQDFELLPVLKQLLESTHFYDEDDLTQSNNIIGAMVKSPMDVSAGTARFFNWVLPDMMGQTNHFYEVGEYLEGYAVAGGMELFNPPGTAGWPAFHQAPHFQRNWISSSTMVNRYRFAKVVFIDGIELPDGSIKRTDVVAWIDNPANISDAFDPNVIVKEMTDYMFPAGADETRRNILKQHLVETLDDIYWTEAWADYKGGGADDTVRVRLNALFSSLLQSPEYQLG